MKEVFRLTIMLAGFLLIAQGFLHWIDGMQAPAKFMVATGIWFELHLFSTMQEEKLGQ